MIRIHLSTVFLFALTVVFQPLFAEVPPYYVSVANTHNVPPVVLFAVAIQESRPPGGVLQGVSKPWPWTMNCEGKPYFLSSKQIAVKYASILISAGINCDIGLMQTNWKWQKHRFNSLDDAFDPLTNINAAAIILKEHYDSRGSWAAAVGAYHSPSNQHRASTYTRRVRTHLVGLLERSNKQ
jgi:hypothetical protein